MEIWINLQVNALRLNLARNRARKLAERIAGCNLNNFTINQILRYLDMFVKYVRKGENEMTIHMICPVCRQKSSIEVSQDQFENWRSGALVQDAFPELTDAERELIITGTHSECWDKMFPQEKDDE